MIKPKLDDLKTLVLIAATIAGAIWFFVPDKIFRAEMLGVSQQIQEVQAQVNGLSLAYLQDELNRLEDKYGHTDCAKMTEDDKKLCRWLKKTMTALGGRK